MLTPVRRTTPRNSLEIIYNLIPLDLFGTNEAINALTRQENTLTQDWIGYNPKYKTYTGHRKFWFDMRQCLISNLALTDRDKGTILNKEYTMDKSSLGKNTLPTLTQVNIYTDGSKTMNHVGAGYVCLLYTSPSPRDLSTSRMPSSA